MVSLDNPLAPRLEGALGRTRLLPSLALGKTGSAAAPVVGRPADQIRRKVPRRYIHSRISHRTTTIVPRSSIASIRPQALEDMPAEMAPDVVPDESAHQLPQDIQRDGVHPGDNQRETPAPPAVPIDDREADRQDDRHRPGAKIAHEGVQIRFTIGQRPAAAIAVPRAIPARPKVTSRTTFAAGPVRCAGAARPASRRSSSQGTG